MLKLMKIAFSISIAAWLLAIASLSIANAAGRVHVTSWTGNGTSQTVTFGWTPQVVFVFARDSIGKGAFKTDLMGSTGSVTFAAAGEITTAITGFTASGYTIGSSTSVNTSSKVFVGVALEANSGFLATGQYTGDGSFFDPGRTISVGFNADFLIVGNGTAVGTPRTILKTKNMTTTKSGGCNGNNGPCEVRSFQGADSGSIEWSANGFVVGDTIVNTNTRTYDWVAIKADNLAIGFISYNGDNSSGQVLTSSFSLPIRFAWVVTAGNYNTTTVRPIWTETSSRAADTAYHSSGNSAESDVIKTISGNQITVSYPGGCCPYNTNVSGTLSPYDMLLFASLSGQGCLFAHCRFRLVK